jgi:hypothetical protein
VPRHQLWAPQEIVEIVARQRRAGTPTGHGMPMAIRIGEGLRIVGGAGGVLDDSDKAVEMLHQ